MIFLLTALLLIYTLIPSLIQRSSVLKLVEIQLSGGHTEGSSRRRTDTVLPASEASCFPLCWGSLGLFHWRSEEAHTGTRHRLLTWAHTCVHTLLTHSAYTHIGILAQLQTQTSKLCAFCIMSLLFSCLKRKEQSMTFLSSFLGKMSSRRTAWRCLSQGSVSVSCSLPLLSGLWTHQTGLAQAEGMRF